MSLSYRSSYYFSRYFAMDVPKVGGQLMIYDVPYPFKIARYQLICLSFSNALKCLVSFLLIKTKHNLFFRNMKWPV